MILVHLGSQELILRITGKWYTDIIKVGEDILANGVANCQLKQEIDNLNIFKVKREKLFFITKTVSFIEFFAFFIAIVIFKSHHISNFEVFLSISKFAGAWFAIKSVGSYGQWSGSILGRATFYTFLLGTIMNIGIAVLLGLVSYKFLFLTP